MFSHIESLVGSIDNHRIFHQSVLFQIFQDTSHITVYRINNSHIIMHILLIFPFCQGFTRQFILFESGNDRIIVFIPSSLLFRIQSIIHISARFFQSRCGMDLILLVRHLQVIHQIHILYNAHFLLGCRNSTFIFIIEVFGHRINHIIIQVKITKIGHPSTMRSLMMNKKTEWFTLVPDAVHPIYC